MSAIKEWANGCEVLLDGSLRPPTGKYTQFRVDYIRKKTRHRYRAGDLLYDVSFVESWNNRDGGYKENPVHEIELSSVVFRNWARKLRSGVIAAVPALDWERLFIAAWSISSLIEQQLPKFSTRVKVIAFSEVKISGELGCGGYGKVFQGMWNHLPVAVKKLNAKQPDKASIDDLLREAELLAECQHPNVVRIFGILLEKECYGMVMELCDRGSLRNLLLKSEPEWAQRWTYGLQVSQGLIYLHSSHILHRDLKSENVLIDANNVARIADFGLAALKSHSATQSLSISSIGQPVVGSLPWMAPELLSASPKYSVYSDIYSLGMLFWEVASLKIPFESHVNSKVLAQLIISGVRPECPLRCPVSFREIVESCWQPVPAERPTLPDIVVHLRKWAKLEAHRWWHCAPQESVLGTNDTVLMSPKHDDVQKLLRFYQRAPVEGMEIGQVEVIHHPGKTVAFRERLRELQERTGKPVFQPAWQLEPGNKWRTRIHEQCEDLTREFVDDDFPSVKLMPTWHGTNEIAAASICKGGYAALSSTDDGFFGKGLYFANEAEYSHRVYGKVLIFNWIAFFSPLPVIDGDMNMLRGKGAHKNYDAHFVPVIGDPKGANYFPTKPNQKPTYTEVVVFENAQCLPRYLVRLRKLSVPKTLPTSAALALNMFAYGSGIDLRDAATACWSQHLSKAYTLKTLPYDLKYKDILRPNHGLAHTLRTVAYVPFVTEFYLQHNGLDTGCDLFSLRHWIQLGMIFFVSGRENEAGSRDDPIAYERFRVNSAQHFRGHVLSHKIPNVKGVSNRVSDAIYRSTFDSSPLHSIMKIAHDVDCLRCQCPEIYDAICAPIANHIGIENTNKLRLLVLRCTQATGDRILGLKNLQCSYNDVLFKRCSTSVGECMNAINSALQKSV